MAYKPTTGTSILDNDFRLATSEGVYEALQLKQDALPSQSGNEDKVLVSDGSDLSWQYAGLGSGNFGSNNVILGRDKPASITTAESVVIIGSGAGNAITSGANNVAIGTNALASSTLTDQSVAIGRDAARLYNAATQYSAITAIGGYALSKATGGNNTAVGQSALEQVTSGNQNTALGFIAGRYATGSNNTFVGRAAGTGVSGQTTGSSNTAVGQNALTALTTGGANVAIGARAADALTTGNSNIAIGNDAAGALTTGSGNVAVGIKAAGALTANSLSVAIGYESLITFDDPANTWKANVAIGPRTLRDTTTGFGNVSVGVDSLRRVTTANQNVALGWFTGDVLTTGSSNILLGADAGGALTTGSFNILLGHTAGDAITTGLRNVIIGDIAGSAALADTIIVAAGSAERFRVDSSGNMGIGTSTPSARLDVNGNIKATSGDVIIDTAGKGLKVKTGANAKMGTAVFSNTQTVTVNTTAALASSLIFVTQQDGGEYFGVANKSNGSFDITHGGGNVTAVVAWVIIDPA